MRKIIIGISVGFSISLASASTVGRDFYSIIQESVNNSPQYKYINYQLSSREMEPAIKLGKLLPKIDLTGSLTSSYIIDGRIAGKYIESGAFGSGTAAVALTQPLYDYGAYKDYQSASEGVEFAQQDYRTNYQQFLYDVSYAYFNLARAAKNVSYIHYNKKAAEVNLNELQQKYDENIANVADYETSKSNSYLAEADYASAVRDKRVAAAELRKFTNNDDKILLFSNKFKLKDPNPNSEEGWEQLAMRSNPAYLGSMHTKESNYYNYQSATSPFMPKVNFEMKYAGGINRISSLGNPVFDKFLPANGAVDGFYVGLNISWSIFAGGTDYAQLKKAAYNYQSSEFNMIQTGRVARNDTMQAYRFIEYKKNQIIALRKSVASAKIAYEKYKEKYEQGTTTITQYFILLNEYYQFLVNLNNAEFDYVMGFLSLYKSAGILTTSVIEQVNNWVIYNQNVEL